MLNPRGAGALRLQLMGMRHCQRYSFQAVYSQKGNSIEPAPTNNYLKI